MSIIEKAMSKLDSTQLNDREQIKIINVINEQQKGMEPDIELDLERLKRLGLVTHLADRSNLTIVNEYRSIKQKLIYNAFGIGAKAHKNANLVMVSSTIPGEGKTFSSVNLALSLSSEKDKTVLLVDADILKPDVKYLLNIDDKPGLIDYLNGDVSDIGTVIYSTNIPNLKILPAGSVQHDSNELFSSKKMLKLTQELATKYSDRIVLFDCPPILGVVESVQLSKYLGQAMLVVEPGKTKMANIEAALAQLSPELAIGFIMNKVANSRRASYGYGYGYGYEHENRYEE